MYDGSALKKDLMQKALYEVIERGQRITMERMHTTSDAHIKHPNSINDPSKLLKVWVDEKTGAEVAEYVSLNSILKGAALLEYVKISRNRGRKHAYHNYQYESDIPENPDIEHHSLVVYSSARSGRWHLLLVTRIVYNGQDQTAISKTYLDRTGTLLWPMCVFSGVHMLLEASTSQKELGHYMRFKPGATEPAMSISTDQYVFTVPPHTTSDGRFLVHVSVFSVLMHLQAWLPYNPAGVTLPDISKVPCEPCPIQIPTPTIASNRQGRKKSVMDTPQLAPRSLKNSIALSSVAMLLTVPRHILVASAQEVVGALLKGDQITERLLKNLVDDIGETENIETGLISLVVKWCRRCKCDRWTTICICSGECGKSAEAKLVMLTFNDDDLPDKRLCVDQLVTCRLDPVEIFLFVFEHYHKSGNTLHIPLTFERDNVVYALSSVRLSNGEHMFIDPLTCIWKIITSAGTEPVSARNTEELSSFLTFGKHYGQLAVNMNCSEKPAECVPNPQGATYTRLDLDEGGFGRGILHTLCKTSPHSRISQVPALSDYKISNMAIHTALVSDSLSQQETHPIAEAYLELLANRKESTHIAIIGPVGGVWGKQLSQFPNLERITDKTKIILVVLGAAKIHKLDGILEIGLQGAKEFKAVLHSAKTVPLAGKFLEHLAATDLIDKKKATARTERHEPEVNKKDTIVAHLIAMTSVALGEHEQLVYDLPPASARRAMEHILCCVAWKHVSPLSRTNAVLKAMRRLKVMTETTVIVVMAKNQG